MLDRHGGHPAAGQGRVGPGRREVLDAALAAGHRPRRCRACSSSTPSTASPRRTPTSPATSSRRAWASSSSSTSGTSSRTRPTRPSTSISARLRREAPFLDFAPIVSISAKTGQRVGKVLELAVDIVGRAPTPDRDRRAQPGHLRAAVERTAAAGRSIGRRPKFYYATQAALAPPTFVFFASDAEHRPLLLPALPREPAARRVRLRRHADAARRSASSSRRAGASPANASARGTKVARQGRRARPEGSRTEPRGSPARRPSRVAVVGAGAWGTTLAVILAQREPVTLVAPLPGGGGTASATRGATRRTCRASRCRTRAAPRTIRRRSPRRRARRHGRARRRTCARRSHRSLVHRPGRDTTSCPSPRASSAARCLRMSQVIAEAGSIDPRRVPPCPGPTSRRRSRAACRRRPSSAAEDVALARADRGAAGQPSVPALPQQRPRSASSSAGRSRTSSPSRLAPRTRSASATTARPAS